MIQKQKAVGSQELTNMKVQLRDIVLTVHAAFEEVVFMEMYKTSNTRKKNFFLNFHGFQVMIR